MKTSEIGINAGKIWHLIDQKGSMDIAKILKLTKLDSDSVSMALGWLARENKILFDQQKEKMIITLMY